MLLTMLKSDFKTFLDIFSNWIEIDYIFNVAQETISYIVNDDFIRDFKFEVINSAGQTNYTTMLIRLLFKAHGDNFNRLLKVYPHEALTIWAYQNCPEFYKQLQ